VPVKIPQVGVDTSVGGYSFRLLGGRLNIDFRDIKRGLDLQGGVKLVLKADMSKLGDADKNKALESIREIISRRVDYLGVAEPKINTVKVGDEYRIEVEIPGIDDVKMAVDAIGQTAQLRFKTLPKELEWTQEKFLEYFQKPEVWVDSGITGADLRGAEVVFSQGTALKDKTSPQIELRFTPEGRKKFSDLAKENVGRPVALFLDESQFPISMPVISQDLANGLTGDPVINGSFDMKSARALSLQIRAGALPVPISVLEQKTVGATLGNESVQKSLKAGAIGLGAVMVFMIVLYGGLGLIANFGLLLYTALVLSVFKIVPVTLTLPGIAGFILSIGMAVDASILAFERIREEIKWGKPRGVALKLGFERSWNSIRDSNISSLITAGVLFYFGSGMVRGFALTLAIGIGVSLFTNILVVRTVIRTLGKF
ncbi:MAG: protein translocase subunit SecD, partial [Patescibacteria group bacterium]